VTECRVSSLVSRVLVSRVLSVDNSCAFRPVVTCSIPTDFVINVYAVAFLVAVVIVAFLGWGALFRLKTVAATALSMAKEKRD
jgi:hypothetical protein